MHDCIRPRSLPRTGSSIAYRSLAPLAAAAAAFFSPLAGSEALAAATLTGDTSKPDTSTFVAGEPVNLIFQAKGAKPNEQLELEVTVADEDGTKIESRKLQAAADAAGNAQFSCSGPNKQLGFYRVRAKLSDGSELPALGSRKAGYLTYAIVPSPESRGPVPEKEAFFAMQGGYGPWGPTIQRLLGIRWGLDNILDWKKNEPDRAGQYKAVTEFKPQDPPNGWVTYGLPTLFMAPKWAVKEGTHAYNTGTLTPEAEKAWDAYCREAAKTYMAKNPNREERIYQITWEPVPPWGFKGKDEDIVRIYEIAYKALHETDDKAVVAGPTRGLEKDDMMRTMPLFALGLGRYIDAFSVHPYFPLSTEKDGMIREVRLLQESVRKYTRHDIPFLGTEQGFSTHENPDEELEHARGLIRQNLIMKGEGFRFNFAFFITDYRLGEQHGYGYYYTLVDGVPWAPGKVGPKPIVPAYAAQSLLLEGWRPAGAIEWLGDTTWGYAFEREGRVILALWDFGASPRTLEIPTGVEHVTIYDWMGNPSNAAGKNGNLTVTLTSEPIYVEGVSPQIWDKNVEKLLSVEPSAISAFPKGKATLEALVKNTGKEPLQADVVVAPDTRLGLPGSRQSVTLEPGGRRTVVFAWDIPGSAAPARYPVKLILAKKGTTIAIGGATVELESPAAITQIRPIAGDQPGVAVSIRDRKGEGLSGTLTAEFQGMPGSKRELPCEIPPGAEKSITIPYHGLALEPWLTYPFHATLKTHSGAEAAKTVPLNFLSAQHRQSKQNPGAPTISLTRRNLARSPKYYTDEKDTSAALKWAWDNHALYLFADVTDDIYFQPASDVNSWRGDSLQLAFDLDPRREEQVTGNLLADAAKRSRYTELAVALTKNGPETFRHLTFDADRFPMGVVGRDKIQLDVKRTERGLLYEIAIPWTELGANQPPKEGDSIGVAVAVNDADEADQKDPSALGLFGGINPKKDPAKFGLLTLQKSE